MIISSIHIAERSLSGALLIIGKGFSYKENRLLTPCSNNCLDLGIQFSSYDNNMYGIVAIGSQLKTIGCSNPCLVL